MDKDNKYLKSSLFEITKLFHPTKHKMMDQEGMLYNARNSIEVIFSFYNIPFKNDNFVIKNKIIDLEALLRPTGFSKRNIKLDGAWWKDAKDAFLGETINNEVIALIPYKNTYRYYDYSTGSYIIINEQTVKNIKTEAVMFYRPLPDTISSKKELFHYISTLINKKSYNLFLFSSFLVIALALLTPYINALIFSKFINTYQNSILLSVLFIFFSIIMLTNIFNYIKTFTREKIALNISNTFSSSIMAKLINLPTSFFSKYNTAELITIISNLETIPQVLITSGSNVSLSLICVVIYTPQILLYAPSLLLPIASILLIQVIMSLYAIYQETKYINKQLEESERLYSITHNFFSGLAKIKYCGAEKRALSKWLFEFRKKVILDQNPPFLLKYVSTITTLITLFSYYLIFYIGFKVQLTPASFVGFCLSYTMLSSSIHSIIESIESLATITPIYEHAEDFLKTPIRNKNTIYLQEVKGKIEFNNVSFTYPGQTNKVLDKVSLTINEGEYVAIAGKTGIGKSTLFRLILGFEQPQEGSIYIDGKDINNIDPNSFRKHFGTVLQNNRLIPGTILSNIKISNPDATLDQVWQVCKIASFDKDIDALPLGLNTNVGENGGNLSGGQVQRLMIARALLSNPSVLLFDEAMTAIDYQSQKNISQAIEKLTCTRLIVSHRLSTIRYCDRIIVLDNGKIVGDGTFAELESNNEVFQNLIYHK